MSREPGLTYDEALRILWQRDVKWLAHLSGLLGEAVIAVDPIGTFTVLGRIEPDNEANGLVRKALETLPDRFRESRESEHLGLANAAHSMVVVAAYFEALREAAGPQHDRRHQPLSNEEKGRLVAKTAQVLYMSDIPAPCAPSDYAENRERVRSWLTHLNEHVAAFAFGLAADQPVGWAESSVLDQTMRRYASHFLDLAPAVPIFRVWAALDEDVGSASTPAAPDEARADLEQAFSGIGLETPPGGRGLHAVLAAMNRHALDETIIPGSSDHRLVFPTVGEAFLNPRYRFAAAAAASQLADEAWWAWQPVEDGLDLRLAAHLSSAESTRLPLLVLGHPGSGKSTLTRVLAARLPEHDYTVVRVPLHLVDAHATIHQQIQQALDQATHGRAEWSEIITESRSTTRVVILDGLDEMLFQVHSGLTGYLRSVREYQRTELAMGRPVAVIVTSRTVVADRVDVPEGTSVVKLEGFDERQIRAWITVWNTVNAAGISTGAIRAMDARIALEQSDLASLPLLLAMMAVYNSDPSTPAIGKAASITFQYERLLTYFAEREATKTLVDVGPLDLRVDIERQLLMLSIAAIGMFNRGRQEINAGELEADLRTLGPPGIVSGVGHQTLARFFFVHVTHARIDLPDPRYEFLHATFGEYLAARLVAGEVVEVTRAAFSTRRGVRDPDDHLLFALLSHEVLSARQPLLRFAEELLTELDNEERRHIAQVLGQLLARYRDRHGSDIYQGYQPRPVDRVRELAAYSANLMLLLRAVGSGSETLQAILWRIWPEPERQWRSMRLLWQAGVTDEAWRSLLAIFAHE